MKKQKVKMIWISQCILMINVSMTSMISFLLRPNVIFRRYLIPNSTFQSQMNKTYQLLEFRFIQTGFEQHS